MMLVSVARVFTASAPPLLLLLLPTCTGAAPADSNSDRHSLPGRSEPPMRTCLAGDDDVAAIDDTAVVEATAAVPLVVVLVATLVVK